MFHVELRQFPHNACAFNLTEAELAQIVEPWSRDEWIEVGERKWSPHQARLTVLEGPHLEIEDLAMGRGWQKRRSTARQMSPSRSSRARSPQRPLRRRAPRRSPSRLGGRPSFKPCSAPIRPHCLRPGATGGPAPSRALPRAESLALAESDALNSLDSASARAAPARR